MLRLHQARDVLLGHRLPQPVGNDVDKLLTVQNPADVVVVEDLWRSRQTKRCTANDDTLGCARRGAGQDLLAALDEVIEQLRELARCSGCGFRRSGCRRLRRRFRRTDFGSCGMDRLCFLMADAVPGRVQATKRLVERRYGTCLRMIDEQRCHVVAVSQDAVDESFERLFRTDFDKHPRACFVKRFETINKLHRRGNLLAEQIDDFVGRAVARFVELARDIADDGQLGFPHLHAGQHPLQGLARGRDDTRVKRVTDREGNHVDVFCTEALDGFVDRGGFTPDHCLLVAVDVGNHGIAVDAREHALHVSQRGKYRSHLAIVFQRDVGHLAPSGTNGLERIPEIQHASLHERCIFAEAVAHHHVRLDAVAAQQLRKCAVRRQHCGLRDLGLLQRLVAAANRFLATVVDEDVFGQQLIIEVRAHDAIGLLEYGANSGFMVAQFGEHVDVL